MSLNTSIKWIHPTNFDGNYSTGPGFRKVILHLTGICTTIGANYDEDSVIKLDISELRTPTGAVCTRTVVEKIKWTVDGFKNASLYWDRSPNDIIAVLPAGHGKSHGDLVDNCDGGGSGNIVLSTIGAMDGAAYDITISIRLK